MREREKEGKGMMEREKERKGMVEREGGKGARSSSACARHLLVWGCCIRG